MLFKKYENTLKGSLLFQGVNRDDLHAMLSCLQPRLRHYLQNEFIALAGDEFYGLGIIVRGKAAIIKESASGSCTILSIMYSGDLFGEMAAFSSHPRWPATVQAQETSTAIFLARDKIIEECSNTCPHHQRLIQNMLRIVSEKALELNKKVEYLTIKSIRGRLSAYLIDQYHKFKTTSFILPVNRNQLADLLNVSRPSMSREMGRMRDEGVIDFHLSAIRILDLESLKSMAD
ncbi:MAG TPA: Crp/Fnr family transcriptional regulator [Firmicutes bacterium]|nr:Crp/Fnr family transcriptional regulator [Bacillota bacterium]